MSWTRRQFVISTALIGASGVIAARRTARAPVRLLRSGERMSTADFERGVRARFGGGNELEVLTMPTQFDLAQWRRLGEEIRGGVVLGIVSAAEFVLVNELIRERGARLLCQGEGGVRNPEALGDTLAQVALDGPGQHSHVCKLHSMRGDRPAPLSGVSFVFVS